GRQSLRRRATRPHASTPTASSVVLRGGVQSYKLWPGHVSLRAHRENRFRRLAAVRIAQFRAQPHDVHVDGPRLDPAMADAPYARQQFLTRHRPLPLGDEKAQKSRLWLGKLHGVARRPTDLTAFEVDHAAPQPSTAKRRRPIHGAAQHRLHARQQLSCGKWFDYVVVRAALKPLDAVLLRA